MRKCYVARLVLEVLVTSEGGLDEALQAGQDAISNEAAYNLSTKDVVIELAEKLPSGWSEDCLVYGDHGCDLCAGDALKLNEDIKP
jgi:hypothetical protein